MKAHWTERSVKDYLFRIAADFIAQLEKKMESLKMSQDELAQKLGITKGRVSQVLNHPGNLTLGNVITYARTLGMKVSIVAYEDDYPENKRGPINSEIFRICWEQSGKPSDFWAVQEIVKINKTVATTATAADITTASGTGGYLFSGNLCVPGYFPIERFAGNKADILKRDELLPS